MLWLMPSLELDLVMSVLIWFLCGYQLVMGTQHYFLLTYKRHTILYPDLLVLQKYIWCPGCDHLILKAETFIAGESAQIQD